MVLDLVAASTRPRNPRNRVRGTGLLMGCASLGHREVAELDGEPVVAADGREAFGEDLLTSSSPN